jgi:uncharacterized membrane protein YidH (DUF202 family)
MWPDRLFRCCVRAGDGAQAGAVVTLSAAFTVLFLWGGAEVGRVRGHWRTLASGKRVRVRSYSRGKATISLIGVVLVVVFVLAMISAVRGG